MSVAPLTDVGVASIGAASIRAAPIGASATGVATAEFRKVAKQTESLQARLYVVFHQSLLSGIWARSHPVKDLRDYQRISTGNFTASSGKNKSPIILEFRDTLEK
jgi:hypothetical protein